MHSNWKEGLQQYIHLLKNTYNLTEQEILQEITNTQIPANIYNTTLTPLQATSKYLQETGKTTKEIAQILGKDQRNIASQLLRAKKKLRGEAQ
ncbi:MAG: sigma factor-like helix-turn-helix DNA-binding protein [Candidatus Woesearchaeota archaeon]